MKKPFYQLEQTGDVIRHFTPNWFTATMGTGVVAMILAQLPFASSVLFMLATKLWQFNILLFAVFSVLYALRWILFPTEAKQIFTHPNMSLFLGAIPMGLATIANGFLSFGTHLYGDIAIQIATYLWYIDVFLAIVIAWIVPFCMFSCQDHHLHRMRQFVAKASDMGMRLIESDNERLVKLAGGHGHQGVVAKVQEIVQVHSLDELLENLEQINESTLASERVLTSNPLILVLDGVTDPHNLGACLRVADGAGVHAVIAPKDNAAGINATVAKVASGAAETVPYFMVTNLARTLNELKERNIWVIGTSDQATKTLYQADLKGPVALVLGAEGDGIRQLTAKTCDELISIPMLGAVESLNVSVASGVCLYEALRQRTTS